MRGKYRKRATYVCGVPPSDHVCAADVGEFGDLAEGGVAVLGHEAVGTVGAGEVVEGEACVVVGVVEGNWEGCQ